jgi:hypothetical protein
LQDEQFHAVLFTVGALCTRQGPPPGGSFES